MTKYYIITNQNDEQINESNNKNTILKKKNDKCKFTALGDKLVVYNVKIPKNAIKFIPCPYVPNGFENSCSECSAEMILRNFGVVGWSQYEIHSKGYQTFEGGVSEGDYGIKNMFLYEDFCDKNGNKIEFHVKEKDNGTIEDLKRLIDQDIPIIVRIFTDSQYLNKHTIVIVGYNNDGVFKHDNDMGMSIFVPNAIFKNQWSRNYFIIYPKNKNKER